MSSKGYNVPTKNRFAQLDSDAESDNEKTSKKVISEAPAPLLTAQRRERPSRQQESRDTRGVRNDQDRPVRGFRGGRGGARTIGDQQSASPTAANDDDVPPPEDRSNRPARRGLGRYERGGRGGAFRGRELDRRSGTGRGREMKKSGAGGHNWGAAAEITEAVAPIPNTEAPTSGKKVHTIYSISQFPKQIIRKIGWKEIRNIYHYFR